MLVTFSTDNYSDITMFGDVAIAMLKMMGHSPTIPGAILAEDVPPALSRLKSAISTNVSDSNDAEEEGERFVSLAHRALPLIELLESAVKKGTNVMWK